MSHARTQAACGTRHEQMAACAVLRLRARSPAGVPLRFLPAGLSSRGLSSGPGFPKAARNAAGFAARAAAGCSDAPRAPVLVPAGMMPGPPGRGLQIRARAPQSRPVFRYASRTRPLVCEIRGGYRHRRAKVKGVAISADESKQFDAWNFLQIHVTPMIRIEKRSRSLACHAPPTGKRAFTRGTRYCPKWPAR